MTEEEFYLHKLRVIQQAYQDDVEPIIKKLVAIRQRELNQMFVFMDIDRQSVEQQQILQTVKAEVIK